MSGSVIENPTARPSISANSTCSAMANCCQLLGEVAELGVRQPDESPQLAHRGVVDFLAAVHFGREIVQCGRAGR